MLHFIFITWPNGHRHACSPCANMFIVSPSTYKASFRR